MSQGTSDVIQYYDERTQKLKAAHDRKIKELIRRGCMKRITADHYEVLPLLEYNKTVYHMHRQADGSWNCTCQGYNVNHKCTHQEALFKVMKDTGQGSLF